MSSKKHLFEDIKEDRMKGMSLFELSKKYRLAKSTVSLWCKNIEISQDAKKLIQEKWLKSTAAARRRGVQKNKDKRIESIEKEYIQAQNLLGNITSRDLLIIGIGLYWAEGSKKETGSGFSFINSDPLMVKMMYEWLLSIMGMKREQLIVNLAINISHKEREDEILKFWSNLLDFPVRDFGNTTFIKTPYARVYDNHPAYFGMLRIKVKSSSWLRRRILGMIKIFADHMPA